MATIQSNNVEDLIGHINELEVAPGRSLHFTVHITDKTLLIHPDPNGETTLHDGEEYTNYLLTHTTINYKSQQIEDATLFLTADIDGRSLRYIIISPFGTALSTGYAYDPNFGS